MKISNIGYVTIKSEQSLLGMAGIKCVATGKKRPTESGAIEAEFICIEPGSNCEKIWATKDQLV